MPTLSVNVRSLSIASALQLITESMLDLRDAGDPLPEVGTNEDGDQTWTYPVTLLPQFSVRLSAPWFDSVRFEGQHGRSILVNAGEVDRIEIVDLSVGRPILILDDIGFSTSHLILDPFFGSPGLLTQKLLALPDLRIEGTNGNDSFLGSFRTDLERITLNLESDNVIQLKRGNDIAHAGSGEDRVFGGAGRDTLLGEAGNDRLFGGTGNDRIDGGRGRDVMEGGAGADVFVLRAGCGRDVVTDLVLGEDKIDLIGNTPFVLTQTSAGAVLQFGSDQMLLRGVSVAAINNHPDDLII
jgi:Ca2+-binding RTX toxin-like protein